MARDDDLFFEPRIGTPSGRDDASARRSLSYTRQVMRAVARAGGNPRRIGRTLARRADTPRPNARFNARGRGAKIVRTFPRVNGWTVTDRGMRFRARRVLVKTRVVKMRGPASRAAYAHLRYLQREGVALDGERGRLYSALADGADAAKFLERGQDDRHKFRLIVAPEDGPDLASLRDFTCQLMAQMERDLETTLDWVAVDHLNTGHPHSHVVIRGVTDEGKTLNIAGDYIAYGIRHRASEILTLELGLQSEWEVQQKLGQEIEQERFTRLDRAILEEADASGLVDLRMGEEQSYLGRVNQYLLLDRLKKLQRLGLAKEEEPLRWSLSSDLEKTLRAMGERGDIIKTMHRAITERGLARGADQYVIHHGPDQESTIIGRVIGKGLASKEMTDRIHLVIDGIDARVHYAEMAEAAAGEIKTGSIVEVGQARAKPREADRNIAELARESGGIYEPGIHLSIARDTVRIPDGNHEGYVVAHTRRLEALRRAGIVERLDGGNWRIPPDFEQQARDYDTQRTKQLGARVLSLIDLDTQVSANAATWLDRELVGGATAVIRDSGFGQELRAALARRQRWLVEQDLARQEGDRMIYRAGMLRTLARRELLEAGARLARERGTAFHIPESGERISGRYREALRLVSGKYALVETSREFTLVPWRPVVEKELGRQINGIVMGDGISWEFGRKRGRSIDV